MWLFKCMKFIYLYNLICEDKINDLIIKYPQWEDNRDALKNFYSNLSDTTKRHNKFGKFLDWLLREVQDFTPQNTSAESIENIFAAYLKYNIDLERYYSLEDIQEYITDREEDSNRDKMVFDANVKKIYEDKEKYVIRVWNFEGSKKYGSQNWCISKDEFRWYDYIINPNICRNPYFVIYKHSKPIYFNETNLNKCCIQRDINDNLFITDLGNSVGDGLFGDDADSILKLMKLDKIEDKFISFKDDPEFETFVKKNDNWLKYLTTISPIYDEVIKYLDPNIKNTFELRKMWFDAIDKKNIKEIQRLIDAGIDVNIKNNKDESALAIMIIEDFPKEFIDLFFNHPKTNLNITVSNKNRPLLTVAYTNIRDVEIIKQFILDPRIDINATDIYGISLLHEAAIRIPSDNLLDIILSRKDLNVNPQTFRDKNTPLHSACSHNQYTNIKKLLAHPDIKPNMQNIEGDTPLMFALIFGNYECVRVLLQDPKVDITLKDKKGRTAQEMVVSKRLLDLFSQYRGAI